MRGAESLRAASSFVSARWGLAPRDRAALLRRQERHLARFLGRVLPQAPFYSGFSGDLAKLPIVDKSTMLANFQAFNTAGISLDQALSVALAAEGSRDFAPTLPGGITVGLSSGTSGRRGVFLVSAPERARWAGVLLARLLAPSSLRQILGVSSHRGPLKIAFFLRANSNLYSTLGSRRIHFAFFDLLEPMARHLDRLNAHPPDILTAPPTVLRVLAEAAISGDLRIAPRQVISVAEVLEQDDERKIEAAWSVPVQQIYQATEGFLGASCSAGRVHLNEDLLHIEPEWLDAERKRFHPIVTDFTRTTQLVARYRLDDVLRLADGPCVCGRPTLSLAAIEGRADDVLWGEGLADHGLIAIFPDLVRRSMALVSGLIDYRVEQHGREWWVQVKNGSEELKKSIEWECASLAARLNCQAPVLRFEPWSEKPLLEKRRRIVCVARPTGGRVSGSQEGAS